MDVTENMTIDENGNSLDINNLNVNCITNSNQKFSIDNEGNIIANTITLKEGNGNIDYDIIFEKLYPVGSIYMSVSDINPGNFFGGIWEQIAKGRTLVGVDTSDTDFNIVKKTGGEKKHKLTLEEMPKHKPEALLNTQDSNILGSAINWQVVTNGRFYGNDMFKTYGGDQAHNNLQPYFTCYIWCRTA